MPGQTLSGFAAALKEVYGPRIEEQLSITNVLSDFIEESDDNDWTGNEVTYPIHVGRNEGIGAIGEDEALPQAGRQELATVKIPVKFNYGVFRLTKQIMASSQKSKGAFTRVMDYEMKGVTRDLGNDLERQNFGAGAGVLCLVNGTQSLNATTNLTVDSPYGVSPTTNGARFLNPNMNIVVLAPTTSTVEATLTIASGQAAIGTTGANITVTGTTNLTLSDNARIVRWGSTDSASGAVNNLNKERMGLLGLIDDGTYVNTLHNVNRSQWPVFKSPVIASIGAISLDVIQRGVDLTDELGGGNFATNGIFFAHHSVRREYLKLLEADRRYSGADLKKPDGGTKQAALKRGGEITYGDVPMRIAKHAPYGTIFGLERGQIVRYIQIKFEWADDDGSILKWVSRRDTWEAFGRIFDNHHTDRPNNGFRLDGINATVDVAHIW